jgi:3-dehydroquinate synthase
MIRHLINLGNKSYPIYITTDFTDLGKNISAIRPGKKVVVVTDENVDKYYSDECVSKIEQSGFEVSKYVLKPGEKYKNLEEINNIYKKMVDCKLDRNSTLVALGGGVVGDMTGFAASTYMRGINFVQVPTTLLAQADSSVGGKTGVDYDGHKNIIGAFYQPRLVHINVNTLKSLPKRDISAGLAETIKHGIIMDEEFFEYIDYNVSKIFNFEENTLQYLAKMNCSIKGGVVEKDEKEDDLRAVLNFGHTIGHAVETVQNFELYHGECVSIGIVGAFKLAQYLELVTDESVTRVKNILVKAGLPVKLTGLDVDKVYNQMFYDKKVKDNSLKFVLPRRIGEVFQCLIEDSELIKKVLVDLSV